MASEWGPLKDEIILLYLVEGLTLDDVSSQMVRRHGFHKKKHQYEYMLKKWKISKNTKKKTWEYVDHVIQKRKKQQKESHVRLHGILLSNSHVTKATQRHGRRSLAGKFRTAPSPQTPEGQLIHISSPPAQQKQLQWPAYLPWAQFDRTLHLIRIQLPQSLMDSMVRALALCSIDFAYGNDVDLAIAMALSKPLNWQDTINQTLPQVQGDVQESVHSPTLRPRYITATQIFKTLLFLISNQKLNATHPLVGQHMMKLICGLCREAPNAVDHLLRSTDPTSATIKETFFAIVVEFGHSLLASRFLAAGTKPNSLMRRSIKLDIYLQRGKASFVRVANHLGQVTPLQLSSAACDIEMVGVLLEFGAKPDLGVPTPLQIVCSRSQQPHTVNLAKKLLHYGARPDTTQHKILLPPLLEAVASQNKKMVQLLLTEGATDNIVSLYGSQVFGLNVPSSLPISLPSRPLDWFNRCGGLCLYENHRTITAIQIAVIVNDTDIMDMLSLSISQHSCRKEMYRHMFITACLAADEDMVHQLLNMDIEIRNDEMWINAAFCAISWISDCRIANILLHNGLVPRWSQRVFVSPVQVAALHGNAKLIELLHSYGYDVNCCPERGIVTHALLESIEEERLMGHWRPLDCAIRFKNSKAALVLLRLGARLSETTLTLAIQFGKDELLMDLLARDASITEGRDEGSLILIAIQKRRGLVCIRGLVNAGAGLGRDALIEAVRQNQQDVTEYLLASGADILASDRYGTRVLETAAQAGNLPLMQRYIDNGGYYDSEALPHAVETHEGTSEHCMIKYLFQCRHPRALDRNEVHSFVQSILIRNHILVEMFLDLRPELYWNRTWPEGPLLSGCGRIREQDFERANRRRVSPLWAAAYVQQEQLVNELILRNHPPDHFLLESVLYHPRFTSKEIRQRLITAYPLKSIQGKSLRRKLLMSAIRWHAEPEILQQHIASLKSLNFFYAEHMDARRTPLQLAAEFGKLGCVKAILEAGADINAPASDPNGMTALQAAVKTENFEMATLLFDAGADVNASGAARLGFTALQQAVKKKNLEMVILLLEHGADVNGLPALESGRTAIELAAEYGLVDILGLLLQHLNLEEPLRIHFVRSVLLAEEGCHSAVVELLRKHGGWTEKDRRLVSMGWEPATEFWHTCPRVLYDGRSWNGKCHQCGDSTIPLYPSPASSSSEDSNSSAEDDSIVIEIADSIDVEEQAMQSEVNLLDDDLTMLQDPLEEPFYGDMEVAPSIFAPYDSTDRWLDDLARDYIDSLV